jgi:hypothetical protein
MVGNEEEMKTLPVNSEPVIGLFAIRSLTIQKILLACGIVSSLFYLGLATTTFGKRFRNYSIATFLAVLLFGVLTGPQAAAMIAGQPTPWLGLTERANIYSFMLWVVVFSRALLQVSSETIKKGG